VSRRDFWRILARLQRDGLTLLLTTPYLDEAERCQRVALMDRSRLLTVASPDDLKAEWHGVVVELLARPKRKATELLLARQGVTDVESFGERLHATLAGVGADQAAGVARELAAALVAQGIEVEVARATSPSLEDIFIARIRAREAQGTEATP